MDGSPGSARPRVSVVIPADGDGRRVRRMVATLPEDIAEVVILHRGPPDPTVEVPRSIRPDVRIVRQEGMHEDDALVASLATCTGDAIVMLDAEGSTDGHQIPRFVDALIRGADSAKASRMRCL